MMLISDPLSSLQQASQHLKQWLFEQVFPLWWNLGIDPDGGFYETIGQDRTALPHIRRVRVSSRQIFSLSLAGEMGWSGNWKLPLERGVTYFLERCFLPCGTVRKTMTPAGLPLDDRFSLYEQAFALLGLAAAFRHIPSKKILEKTLSLREILLTRYHHPAGGFTEGDDPPLILKANPHMHLLEACLLWQQVRPDPVWAAMAAEIVQLALQKMIDPHKGWLKEFFQPDWTVAVGDAGKIWEPGHQFEWGWLLIRWGLLNSQKTPIETAQKLIQHAEEEGVDPVREVAMMVLDDTLTIHDNTARLWAQTERLKGHLILASVTQKPENWTAALSATRTIQKYFSVTPGLWLDRMEPDGRLRIEPAPASTLYHLVCALQELERLAGAET